MITNKRIIFDNGSSVSVIVPSPNWQGTIEELATKDVPNGLPYLIVDDTDIPTDRTYRDAWEADFSTPDGYGEG